MGKGKEKDSKPAVGTRGGFRNASIACAVLLAVSAVYLGGFSGGGNRAWRASMAARASIDDKEGVPPPVYPPARLLKGVGKRFEGSVSGSERHKVDAPLPSATLPESYRSSMLWGTYTPSHYFGARTRAARGTVSALMWMSGSDPRGPMHIRHLCSDGDGLATYGWTEHDGRTFGVHEADDTLIGSTQGASGVKVEAEFAKVPEDPSSWTARVALQQVHNTPGRLVTVFAYLALEGAEGAAIASHTVAPPSDANGAGDGEAPGVTVDGTAPELGTSDGGRFRWTATTVGGKSALAVHVAGVNVGDELHRIPDEIKRGMKAARFTGKDKKLKDKEYYALSDTVPKGSTAIVVQLTVRSPAVVRITFASGDSLKLPVLGPRSLSATHAPRLSAAREAFDAKFAAAFPMPQAPPREVVFARSALSNMLGGMGFFAGKSSILRPKVGKNKGGAVKLVRRDGFDTTLFTAVPSRPFFPRGFLWDEGFHHLLLSRFDRAVSLDALGSWLGLVHSNGWIPREQILGSLAITRVPDEFVPQHPEHANPPTLLLAFEAIFLKNNEAAIDGYESQFLAAAYPRLRAWFNWFVRGQTGGRSSSDFSGTDLGDIPTHVDGDTFYFWRGRDLDPDQSKRINPRTLTSGLDDYPRALFPTDRERHVDLHCWVARGADVMSGIARLVGEEKDASGYKALSDGARRSLVPDLFDKDSREFRDWGRHGRVALAKDEKGETFVKRHARFEEGAHGFVPVGPGYISIFPLLLRVLDPVENSDELGAVLDVLSDPEHLWSPHGLRSISTKSPFYRRWNNPHDKPYWRGPVWINVNYLAVDSLRHYASLPGPHAERCAQLATRLAGVVTGTVWRGLSTRRFVFENYDDRTGEGMGCKPFTGWSALAVLLASGAA